MTIYQLFYLGLTIGDTMDPVHEILVLIALKNNEGSGEHVQMGRLTRAIAAVIHNLIKYG